MNDMYYITRIIHGECRRTIIQSQLETLMGKSKKHTTTETDTSVKTGLMEDRTRYFI